MFIKPSRYFSNLMGNIFCEFPIKLNTNANNNDVYYPFLVNEKHSAFIKTEKPLLRSGKFYKMFSLKTIFQENSPLNVRSLSVFHLHGGH